MKSKLIRLGILAILLITSTVFGAKWSEPITISDGSAPDLDIDPITGNVHIVTATRNFKLLYSKIAPNGNTISQEYVPSATAERGYGHFGPSVAVDQNGYPHIAYRQYDHNSKYTLFYVYKTALGWSQPLEIARSVLRGYVFRIDVDGLNRVHIAHGSSDNDVWGPVTYYRIENGNIVTHHEGLERYRADDRLEIETFGDNDLHLLLGSPDPNGGAITYWRSLNGGGQLLRFGDIHSNQCNSRNGSPDIFADASGAVNIVYGAREDNERGGLPSVRYVRFENDNKIIDQPITPTGFLTEWHQSLGLATVAASDDGQSVMVVFQQTDGGYLYAVSSNDGGQNWGSPLQLTYETFSGYEGRNKQMIRANGINFYLVYPKSDNSIGMLMYEAGDNEPPVAHAGGPYIGDEGQSITFDASDSSDDLAIVLYEWDWTNDGIYDMVTASPTAEHIFTDDFIGQVKLRVNDTVGRQSQATSMVTISNAAPTVTSNGNKLAKEGDVISFNAIINDAGTDDTHSILWHFGDGHSSAEINTTHAYADNGTYTARCEVFDDDGGTGTVQFIVNATNQAPVSLPGGPYSGVSGQPMTFSGAATDPGTADLPTMLYKWDLNNDGLFEISSQTAAKTFTTSGVYQIVLKVQDKDGGSDIAQASVSIAPAAPVVAAIPTQEIGENEEFTPIFLDNYVSDYDNPASQISWFADGTQFLSISINSRVATISRNIPNWTGSETIRFIAIDPTGLSDTTATTFTIFEVNDRPVALKINNQIINENDLFSEISLNNYVTDVDNTSAEMAWSFFGNQSLQVSISMETATNAAHTTRNILGLWTAAIAVPDSEWNGSEEINFVVTDPGNASDTTTVLFSVMPVNDIPVITPIPVQIIDQGQNFSPLFLNDYIFDPDHRDETINWTYQGNLELVVTILNRVLQITQPRPDWHGSETIILEATDPANGKATVAVTFTSLRDNKPPVLGPMPTISFTEDDTTYLSRDLLEALASDPDNTLDELSFSLLTTENLNWGIVPADRSLFITSKLNWNGSELVQLVVDDGFGGADSTTFIISVIAENDPPQPFALISPVEQFYSTWPPMIDFIWEKSMDPEGSSISYFWVLSSSEDFADSLSYAMTADTAYTFPTGGVIKQNGHFYWKVLAISNSDSYFSEATNVGHFLVATADVDDIAQGEQPTEFKLMPNYPNPFNPETHITYHLAEITRVRLEVFNQMGAVIRVLAAGEKAAGVHSVTWDGRNDQGQQVSSGVYFYRIQSDKQQFIEKMLLMK